MKKLRFDYERGDIFYLNFLDEYVECVILEEEGYNFSKGTKEYRVQLTGDKTILIVKEKDLIHPQHYKDLMFDQENTDFIDI